jgi:putative nucleotidyltransferase with HDIG domain
MRSLTRVYVTTVTLGAAIWAAALFVRSPELAPAARLDALILCALAVSAELLTYVLPRSASGSLAFIPYFASAIVVPAWPSVASVIVVKGVVEIWARRTPIKAVLNISSHAMMELVAVTVYLGLGGVSLRAAGNVHDLAAITKVAALPALAAFAAGLLANVVIVTIAIATSTGRKTRTVLHENHRATVGLDILIAPVVFIFAWIYAAFGAIAAAAIWVPILGFRQVKQTNLELERTNEELLELMVRSLEARDAYTSGHSRRVQRYSQIIARAIGLSDREVEQTGRAALLHDVGKIHEKYAPVLAKQDKLTPEEWAIIQEHPEDGAKLVATMTRLRDIVPAIRHHHENWDGTGYPNGLSGELIPLASRIIRFADTIDAMTTERPYRLPLTEAQVRSEIVRCRGTQFDPTIADCLLKSPLWRTLFAPDAQEQKSKKLALVGERVSASTGRSRSAIGA